MIISELEEAEGFIKKRIAEELFLKRIPNGRNAKPQEKPEKNIKRHRNLLKKQKPKIPKKNK